MSSFLAIHFMNPNEQSVILVMLPIVNSDAYIEKQESWTCIPETGTCVPDNFFLPIVNLDIK